MLSGQISFFYSIKSVSQDIVMSVIRLTQLHLNVLDSQHGFDFGCVLVYALELVILCEKSLSCSSCTNYSFVLYLANSIISYISGIIQLALIIL